jgi:hypothetical protein
MLKKNKYPKATISAIAHKHHFINPNSAEIIFTLLFIGIIYRVLSFIGRE